MGLKEEALYFFRAKNDLEEQERLLYVSKRKHAEMVGKASNLELKLKLAEQSNEIYGYEGLVNDRQLEYNSFKAELLYELKNANYEPEQRFKYHLHDESYFDVWYDQNDEVYAFGPYSDLSRY